MNETTELAKQQKDRPPQTQPRQPGLEYDMEPKPVVIRSSYRGSGKLEGKVAIITGGDSGIGRAAAVHFAREGADVAVLFLDEELDARETRAMVEAEKRRCVLIGGDIADPAFCTRAVTQVIDELGALHILVSNAAEQHAKQNLTEISPEQLERTFRTNIFGAFYITQAALRQMPEGGCILITTSVTAYEGHETLVDYAATKGALTTLTRSLARKFHEKRGEDCC